MWRGTSAGAAGNERARSRDQGQQPTSARMEQGSSAGAAGNKRVGGENGRRQSSAHGAGIEGRGQRVTSAHEAGMERGSGGKRAHRQRDRAHRWHLSGEHGASIEGLGGGGGGEQRARMGAGIERGSGGQRANHRARNGAGIERAGCDSIPGGFGCRGRKGEVKGGIGDDIRYAGWARMRGNKRVRR
jgi:hypothetical protein